MSNEYSIETDNSGASICIGDDCDFMTAFINIYVEYGNIKSPFRTVEDAELFAKILIKLLKVVT